MLRPTCPIIWKSILSSRLIRPSANQSDSVDTRPDCIDYPQPPVLAMMVASRELYSPWKASRVRLNRSNRIRILSSVISLQRGPNGNHVSSVTSVSSKLPSKVHSRQNEPLRQDQKARAPKPWAWYCAHVACDHQGFDGIADMMAVEKDWLPIAIVRVAFLILNLV